MGPRLIWRYDTPLHEATFLRRYKRFFADVRFDDGRELTVHCANTGTMLGVDRPGSRCRVSLNDDPKRKLKGSLEQIQADGAWVMVHTARPNAIVEAAIRADAVPGLGPWTRIRREVRYGEQRSRIDLLLEDDDAGQRFVEVKNCTLVRDGVAAFPDAVSARGRKHLEELAHVVSAGHGATLVLHVARDDADVFAPADDLDPAWADAYRSALDAGVQVVPLAVHVTAEGIGVAGVLPHRRTLDAS